MTNTESALHLWFKPYNGIMADCDTSFTERYSRRFYPKAISELGRHLRKAVAVITTQGKPGAFEYQMRHYTTLANGRYVIEESLRETADDLGFNLGIQATSAEERKIISQFAAEESPTARLQPVANVIAYLEDSIESESHKWEQAKMFNGQDALPVLREIIAFLKNIKTQASVFEFSMNEGEKGTTLTLVLVSPGVMAYYTRLDWVIV